MAEGDVIRLGATGHQEIARVQAADIDGLPAGPPGADGKTILNGAGAPGAIGALDDFYLDTTASAIYGPKTGGGWGSPTSLIGPAGLDGDDGAPGTPGTPGTPGAAGADGKTVRYGTGAPGSGLGADGDFYIATDTNYIYGPKATIWPAGTSLVGPQGAAGQGTPAEVGARVALGV